jgi:hypothetical protein
MIKSNYIILGINNVSNKIFRENQNTHFMFSNFFSENRAFYEVNGKLLYSRSGHRCQGSMWIAYCINKATNLLLIRNNYFFSTAVMVARMRLNVTLYVHCLSCFILLAYINIHIEINPLNTKLNPICHLLALVGAHPIFHVSRIRAKWHPEFYNILWHEVNICAFIRCAI